MTSVLAVVQRRFEGVDDCRALAAAEGGLVQGWTKSRRLFVVASVGKKSAVILFNQEDPFPEGGLPIDRDFK